MQPEQTWSKRFIDYFYLERGLLFGLGLLLIGIGLNVWLVWQWGDANWGPLQVQLTMRWALWGFTTMVVGAQTMFGSFFLGVLKMAGKDK
jgi:hypothetical protein